MTRQETGVVMNILATAYPRFYAGPNRPDPQQTVKLWSEMFEDDDLHLVLAAVKALISTDDKGFPPHIGAVKAKIRQISQPGEMSEAEAWGYIRKALKDSSYHAQKEFDALPPIVQQIVCTPEQLREWARMDEATVQSVVASNVQRSYRAKAKHAREFNALPRGVKELAQSIARSIGPPPGEPEKPQAKALPAPEKTKEQIAADIEKMKAMVRSKAPAEHTFQATAKITDEEFARNRQEAIRKLRALP